jgi:hypothetical protein
MDDGLLRQTVFVGLREDSPARTSGVRFRVGRQRRRNAMEPLGHINLMEIVKVERQSSGAGNKWLIFDQSRKHIETRFDTLISPHIQDALGHDTEGYFQGDWSAQGWKIGDRVLPPKG